MRGIYNNIIPLYIDISRKKYETEKKKIRRGEREERRRRLGKNNLII
jgi:hypothetical protein